MSWQGDRLQILCHFDSTRVTRDEVQRLIGELAYRFGDDRVRIDFADETYSDLSFADDDDGDEDDVDETMLLTILRTAQARASHPEAARQLNELVFALQAPEPAARTEILVDPRGNRTAKVTRTRTTEGRISPKARGPHAMRIKHEVIAMMGCPTCGVQPGQRCHSKTGYEYGLDLVHGKRINLWYDTTGADIQ